MALTADNLQLELIDKMKFSSQAYFPSALTTKFHLPSKRIQNGFFLFSEKYF